MNEYSDLYQQMIIDHSQHPHNFCAPLRSDLSQEGYNPLCGDKIMLYLSQDNNIITDISFQGNGCAISTASASLMTDAIKGKTIAEALELFTEFQELATTGTSNNLQKLGKLAVLGGVSLYPMRIKCATLAWHTLKNMLESLECKK